MSEQGKSFRIDKVVAGLFKERKWDRRLGLHMVFHFWDRAVGSERARIAQPHVIRGSVLWVNVSDSIWMQRLHLEKPGLLEKINKQLPGPEVLSDIRFQLGGPAAPSKATVEEKKGEARLDKKELQRYEQLFAAVPDEDARNSLLKLWIKSRKNLP